MVKKNIYMIEGYVLDQAGGGIWLADIDVD